MDISDKDWELLRAKMPEWQENYMKKLCEEYVEILTGEGYPSERFWAIEKRIREDKRRCDVRAEMRRSLFYDNIFMLLNEGAICLDDLEEFSDEVKSRVKSMAITAKVRI